MSDKLYFTPAITYFSLPYYTFLRKCVVIRHQLQQYGDPKAEVKIRNLPQGSGHYYICYLISAHVQAIWVERDAQGKVVAVHDKFLTPKFQNQVNDFINGTALPTKQVSYLEGTFPTARPNALDLYTYKDEKLGFKADNKYRQKVKYAEDAVQALKNEQAQIILNPDRLNHWIEKHQSFYWSLQMDWDIKAFQPFFNLFATLKYLQSELHYLARIQKALTSYVSLDETWFSEASDLNSSHYFYSGSWNCEVHDESPFTLKVIDREIYLQGEAFETIFKFTEIYDKERYLTLKFSDEAPF